MAKDIFIVALIILIIGIIYQIFFNNPPLSKVSVKIKDIDFSLEVAKTIPQKSKGLMNRNTLAANSGMVFVSEFEMPQIFWMKNTLIPLDMIFVDKNGQVINILTATPEPNSTPDTQLTLYKSASPAKYVIELNAGASQKLNLVSGDKINLSNVK